ncbi:MAG: hypothetical protein RLZZ297_583 [Chloroflexota bacterium]|jgi:Bacterial PH domain
MRRWKPFPSMGRWLALALAIVFTIGSGFFGWLCAIRFTADPTTWVIDLDFFLRFLAFLVMLFCAGTAWLRFISVTSLWYGIDRNVVFIGSLGNVEMVPLTDIVRLDFGVRVDGLPVPLIQGIGCYWGTGRANEHASVLVRSTIPPSRCIFIVTNSDTYAISPAELEVFVQELEQRRHLGATKEHATEIVHGPWFNTPFWHDMSTIYLLAVACLINVIAVGVLTYAFPQLPAQVEMRFDAVGGVSELRPRHQALFLPLAAFGVTLVNLFGALVFFRYDKLIARMLQGASVVVQILFCVAVIMLVRS